MNAILRNALVGTVLILSGCVRPALVGEPHPHIPAALARSGQASTAPLSPWGRAVGGEGAVSSPTFTPSPPTPLPRGERGTRLIDRTGVNSSEPPQFPLIALAAPVPHAAVVSGVRPVKHEDVENYLPPPPPPTGDSPTANHNASTPSPPPGQVLSFPAVISQAAGRNPQIAFAQQRVHEAFAQRCAAEVLWLPTIRAGVSYSKHDGWLQDVEGRTRDISRSAWQQGLGLGAVAAGPPRFHGVQAQFHLADAVFQPHAANHTVGARQAAFSAQTNDILLDASLAYLRLLDASQQKEISLETYTHASDLAELTRNFAKIGQGNQADADRAQAELVFRQTNVERVEEGIQVASARLAELLSQDPTVPLIPAESTVVPIDLVAPEVPARELVATGLSNRPELSESRALVATTSTILRREQFAPLMPSVLLGVSESGFAGGEQSLLGRDRDRFDVDVLAWWELRNLGFGDKAARREALARLNQAKFREIQVMDRVAREVSEAHAQVQIRRKQIPIAQGGVQAAKNSYERNYRRIREGQGLPIEVLQAIQALDQARREYLRILVDYNEAQFRLYRALGWPGEALPVHAP